ncbi:MAG: UDP-4-amino-4,6-dideoxy-N-acetyl-beta-L-altrosamine transaminase [Verrucomicrobiaceae bacterium]|nr:UDP-4-amino-4,6-dideoxy-N-acetyl-beta-L-altrosamine transaminase [Verrucomicrobiaceae bacterium]
MAADVLPYGRQLLDDEDIEEVVRVLRSDFLTQGPAIERFEKAVTAWCGASHGIAMANGTATLHLACKALDVGHGDSVWTSPITFVASANCARYCGAKVDFVDVDPGTVNLCPDRLAAKLEQAEKNGTLPKVVIPVHFAGQNCAMDRIHALSQKYGFRIIEDAAHALGGTYLNERVGNCRWSDMVSHSFHPVKIITSGEGGMITTNDPALAQRVSMLRTHGITRDASLMTSKSHGPWYYQQIELGYNYRMTDIQAALGASQMNKLDAFAARRRVIADLYDQALAGLPLRPLARDPQGVSGWHLYMIRLNLGEISRNRREVFESLRAQGIGVNVHYIPVHLQPDYAKLGFTSGMFPEAERYYEEAITLPMFPAMKDSDVERVRSALVNALGV